MNEDTENQETRPESPPEAGKIVQINEAEPERSGDSLPQAARRVSVAKQIRSHLDRRYEQRSDHFEERRGRARIGAGGTSGGTGARVRAQRAVRAPVRGDCGREVSYHEEGRGSYKPTPWKLLRRRSSTAQSQGEHRSFPGRHWTTTSPGPTTTKAASPAPGSNPSGTRAPRRWTMPSPTPGPSITSSRA